jgi:hypothetical protein
MPAVSKSQQKLMGAALAAKKGSKPISKKVADLSKSMTKKELEKYAGTKHKGLPKKVKEGVDGITEMYAVQQPYRGCQPSDLVVPFNPIRGVPQDRMTPDIVHSVHPDVETATTIAEALCKEMIEYEGMLEEKKGSVVKKLQSAIQKLEKTRKDTMSMVMSAPREATQHKEKIAQLTSQIDNLVSKLERVSSSQKDHAEDDNKDKKSKK